MTFKLEELFIFLTLIRLMKLEDDLIKNICTSVTVILK